MTREEMLLEIRTSLGNKYYSEVESKCILRYNYSVNLNEMKEDIKEAIEELKKEGFTLTESKEPIYLVAMDGKDDGQYIEVMSEVIKSDEQVLIDYNTFKSRYEELVAQEKKTYLELKNKYEKVM